VSGHPFQLTIAIKATELPLHVACCTIRPVKAGQALYSERLADEMCLYSDDVARIGLYAVASWGASRLVVDTGLHVLG
jgi:uncharacterized protein (DUF885 family)